MVHSTLAHAQTNYHVSQFGHWNHEESWHISKLVNNLLFSKIWCKKLWFAYWFLGWHRSHHHDFVRIWNLYGDCLEAICRGWKLLVQQASHSARVTYLALRRSRDRICSYSTDVSLNLAHYDYFLVEMSVAAFAILWGRYHGTPEPVQSFSVQVSLHHHLFAVLRLPEPAMWKCRTSYPFHRSIRLWLPIPVVSMHRTSSAFDETSPGAAAPCSWLCPSPSQVHHFCSAGPSLSLNHPDLPDPPHRRNLQDHSDWLRFQPSFPEISFQALHSSIACLHLCLYPPAPAEPLPLPLQLPFLPQWSLSQHNPGSICLCLYCISSAFLVVSQLQASFWIASCTMPQGLGVSLLPSLSSLDSLDDVVAWSALLICHKCPPEVAKSSFSEDWQL